MTLFSRANRLRAGCEFDKAIEELRKGIISVSANEPPYDIFICHKETADNGERTLDSVLAQDIYDTMRLKSKIVRKCPIVMM